MTSHPLHVEKHQDEQWRQLLFYIFPVIIVVLVIIQMIVLVAYWCNQRRTKKAKNNNGSDTVGDELVLDVVYYTSQDGVMGINSATRSPVNVEGLERVDKRDGYSTIDRIRNNADGAIIPTFQGDIVPNVEYSEVHVNDVISSTSAQQYNGDVIQYHEVEYPQYSTCYENEMNIENQANRDVIEFEEHLEPPPLPPPFVHYENNFAQEVRYGEVGIMTSENQMEEYGNEPYDDISESNDPQSHERRKRGDTYLTPIRNNGEPEYLQME
uniref:uncharacterized protein LOC120340614 n=1 Tax=Styela clava TaxID=7725 RepID=UPI001939516A|nr:uncharacterized protein LOC120340614 [Styela clava]